LTPDETPAVAHSLPAGHGFAVADVLPVPTQKPAAHVDAAGVDVVEPAGHQKPAAHTPPLVEHAAVWLTWPVNVPYEPKGHSVHVDAPAADHAPAGHVWHVEPLRNDPGWHDAVPAKVTPPDRSFHDEVVADDDDAPSAKQKTLVDARLSARLVGFGVNVYDVGVEESAPAGDTVAADHVGEPV
jgi:hypothetical protein